MQKLFVVAHVGCFSKFWTFPGGWFPLALCSNQQGLRASHWLGQSLRPGRPQPRRVAGLHWARAVRGAGEASGQAGEGLPVLPKTPVNP